MKRVITRYIKRSVKISEIVAYGTLKAPIIEHQNLDDFWDNEIGGYLHFSDTANVEYILVDLFSKDLLIPNKRFCETFILKDFFGYDKEVSERFLKYKKIYE